MTLLTNMNIISVQYHPNVVHYQSKLLNLATLWCPIVRCHTCWTSIDIVVV